MSVGNVTVSISDQGSSITSTTVPDHTLIPWNSCRNRGDPSPAASSTSSSPSSSSTSCTSITQSAEDYFGVFMNQLSTKPDPSSYQFQQQQQTASWPLVPQQQSWTPLPTQQHQIYGDYSYNTGCSVDSFSDSSSSSSGYHDMLSPGFQCM